VELLRILRERFSFTRGETTVLLFLSVTYGAGLGVRWYMDGPADSGDSFTYRQTDSTFRALSRETDAVTQRDSLALGSIDVNTASAEELDRLPGIGPHYAREIVRYREQHGRFRTVDELLEVKGIGPKKLARIRPYVRLQ